VKIGDLTPGQLHQRFAGPGLRTKIGPFVIRLHTPIREFIGAFNAVYADFPVCAENEISDFHIRVTPAFRRWPWRERQAVFAADGASPFLTFPRRLAMPFAEWGLNWCICNHAHQFLIFHSAVVEKAGRAAILAGPPGSGKSTLCATLLGRGWRLLSDELALLDPARGWILPIPRPVALKGTSIELIERLLPQLRIGQVFSPTHKGTLAHLRPPTEAVQRQAEPALPGWVVFPTHAEEADTRLAPLGKGATFVRLEKNCFNYDALGRAAFDALSEMIEASGCFELPFAHASAAAELLDGLVELQPVAEVPIHAG
jgi:HprK-related kinase A